jgi:hypothetical protein
MHDFSKRKLLAFIVLAMSVYTLILFITVKYLEYQTAHPETLIVTVVVTPTTPTPRYYEPTPTPSSNPPVPHHNKPQQGGYTGTVTEPYVAPVVPVHYVVRTTVKPTIALKPHHYVHRSRHHHRRHYEHRSRHHHRKHHKIRLDKC